MSSYLPNDQKITVRYVPKTEAPGRPVRIDYGHLAHEYVTRADAADINNRSQLSERCRDATGLSSAWSQTREAYSQLTAVLGGLGPSGDFEVTHDPDGGFTVVKPAPEPVTEADFDLFPVKAVDQVVTGAKVSDSDDPEPEGWAMSTDMRTDPVHAPSHYTDGGIETIDYLRAKLSPEAFVGFCQGNALKYLSRAGKKGSAAEDFAKAEVYCRWAKDAAE